MKQDNKQVPQLIVLGLLVLACIGYVSFKVMSPSDSQKMKPAAAKSAQQNAAGETEAAASVVQEHPSEFPNLTAVPSRRDPFIPQRMPGAIEDPAETKQASKPQPVGVNPMPYKKLPRLEIKPINPFGGSRLSSDVPRPPENPDAQPKFVLTGVVRGDENVAILRAGDGRYVVKQGQVIEGRYRVLLVMSDAVVLSDKGRRIFVRLGGEQNAS